MEPRILQTTVIDDDVRNDNVLRPQFLKDYVGQKDIKNNISICIKAAKDRQESLDHVLFYGPPGLGKTTLACIIANELGTDIKITSGPAIEKPGDMAAILSGLKKGDVLFIDEIHRIPRYIEEMLYSAMEDFKIDLIIGSDGSSRTIKIDLPKFTLVGATTRAGDLTAPLRDRFGIVSKLNYYTDEELSQIVKRTTRVINSKIDDDAALEIAKRSRKTPRIANRLIKRVNDFALVKGSGVITLDITKDALNKLKVDENGLDETDIEFLRAIKDKFNGGPVGIESISASIGEEITTIEDVIEPYLLQEGYIKRTQRGRVITGKGLSVFGIEDYRLF